jgi:hypothetical protein
MFSTSITTTLLLPLLGWTLPMHGPQPISVVWVSTPRDAWGDRTEARAVIMAGLRWWEARTDVVFTLVESELTVDADILSLNVCRDRSWLPGARALPTLYVVAWEPTYRALDCDGVNVADWAEPGRAIVWGGARVDEIAHTVGHVYGASDGHEEARGDIMDYRAMRGAYAEGRVSEATYREIGASPRVGGPARTASAKARRGQRSRAKMQSYTYERSIGGF